MSIEVKWSMHVSFEEQSVIARDQVAIMHDHMDCEGNAESVVNDICEDFFTDELWEEWSGSDFGDGLEVVVSVTAPPSIAGVYRVGLERPVKASARRVATAP